MPKLIFLKSKNDFYNNLKVKRIADNRENFGKTENYQTES